MIQALMQDKGVACHFCDYRELLKEIQNSYNPAVQATELDILRPIVEAEVLVLDELGAVKSSEWVWEKKSREEDDARSASRQETLGDRIIDRMRSRLHDMPCPYLEGSGFQDAPQNQTLNLMPAAYFF